MSNEAMGWAFKFSPYKGSAFQVHLAMADIANDVHNNEVWVVNSKLAAKARVSRQQCNEVLHAMVEDGFLDVVERPEKRGSRRPVKYRFLMPDGTPQVFSWKPDEADEAAEVGPYRRRGVVRADTSEAVPAPEGVVRADTFMSAEPTPSALRCRESRHRGVVRADTEPNRNPNTNEPNGNPISDPPASSLFEQSPVATVTALRGETEPLLPSGFDAFWQRYPHKAKKPTARIAWKAARNGTPEHLILEGLDRWAAHWVAVRKETRFIPHPSTWLRARQWEDEPTPEPAHRQGRRSSTDDRLDVTRRVLADLDAQEAAQ